MSGNKDLRCTVEEAKRFCERTAAHVSALCSSSVSVTTSPSKYLPGEHIRCAFILTLLALEETGKLFRVWQAGARAEGLKEDKIEVQDIFADHGAKGAIAGDLCCQMLDFVSESNGPAPPNRAESTASQDRWAEDARTHLQEIYQDYESFRETAMYTAHDSGVEWSKILERVRANIVNENMLLWLVASGALAYLETSGRFSTATKALVDIQKGIQSSEAYEFSGRMLAGMGKLAAKWSIPQSQ